MNIFTNKIARLILLIVIVPLLACGTFQIGVEDTLETETTATSNSGIIIVP